jgi:lauroyl/myristoyl acyltransferase
MKRVAPFVLYHSYKLSQWLSRTLPRPFLYRFASWVALAFHAIDGRGRRAVASNLRQILHYRGEDASEQRVHALTRRTFVCFGKYLADFFHYSGLTAGDVGRVVKVDHPEYIHQAAAQGKGVLAVSAHFGNWEIGGAVIPALGYRVRTVVLPQRFEKVNRLFQEQRAKRGFEMSFLGQSAGALLRALRAGEFVALLADQDFTGLCDAVPFFGRPARLPRGPAYLAHRMGAPLLIGFVCRQEDDSLVLNVYPPILPEEGLSQEQIQQRICSALEDMIGKYPHQWFVFRDFWGGEPQQAAASILGARLVSQHQGG